MIGKINIGKSFYGCIKYCLEDKIQQENEPVMKNRAEVLLYNKCFGDLHELVQQFQETRQLNKAVSKPVLHVNLSLAVTDKLSRDKLMEVSEQCAIEMGFSNNQYVAVMHRDTNHQHLHIVANRIGFDGKTVSDSNNYRKIANYCRQMEQKFQLKQVLSPRMFLSPEQRQLPRLDQRKECLRKHVQEALSHSRNYLDFEKQMKFRGYRITKGRGISFTDEKKVTFKGSQVNYSLQTIERILQKQQILQPQKLSVQSRPEISDRDLSNDKNLSNNNFEQPSIKLLEQLLKPEKVSDQLSGELLQNQKRRKKHSHHL